MKLIIDLKVKDLSRAVTFYTEALGLVCRNHDTHWAAITVGDAEIHLYSHGATGNVEFYVDDIDAEVKKLKSKGVVFVSGLNKPQAVSEDENGIVTFPWGRTAFFKDSEDNELAIVKDVN